MCQISRNEGMIGPEGSLRIDISKEIARQERDGWDISNRNNSTLVETTNRIVRDRVLRNADGKLDFVRFRAAIRDVEAAMRST